MTGSGVSCAYSCRAGASTGAPQVNTLQIGIFDVISKAVNRHWRFEGSNPSPSASSAGTRMVERVPARARRSIRSALHHSRSLRTYANCRVIVARERRGSGARRRAPCRGRARFADRASPAPADSPANPPRLSLRTLGQPRQNAPVRKTMNQTRIIAVSCSRRR